MKKLAYGLCLFVFLALFHSYHAHAGQPLGNAVALSHSTTGESSHVFSTGNVSLYSLGVTTSTAGYALGYTTTAAPGDGTVAPVVCLYIPANSSTNVFFGYPVPFPTGMTVVFSSTGCFTQTSISTLFITAQVR